MKTILVVLLLLGGGGLIAQSDIAEMSVEEFDQTMGKGWRALADAGRHHDAAVLIDRFLAENPNAKGHETILNFHAGQCYAFAEKHDDAVDRLRLSFKTEYPADFKPYADQWNAYVRATIAFLRGEGDVLRQCRDEINAGPDGAMKESNGRVVDRLIANLGRPYKVAYTGEGQETEARAENAG